jgi:tetratricopeptide (TPR) repeat protein
MARPPRRARRGYALLVLGQLAVERGAAEEGMRCWIQNVAVLRDAGDYWGFVRPLNSLGELARLRGDYDTALGRHREAVQICQTLGDRFGQRNVLCGLAQASIADGSPDNALAYATDALHIALESANTLQVAFAREAKALGYAACGQPDRAVRLWAAAQVRRESIAAPLERRDREPLAEAIGDARGELGDDAFSAAWRLGAALTDDELAQAETEALE